MKQSIFAYPYIELPEAVVVEEFIDQLPHILNEHFNGRVKRQSPLDPCSPMALPVYGITYVAKLTD